MYFPAEDPFRALAPQPADIPKLPDVPPTKMTYDQEVKARLAAMKKGPGVVPPSAAATPAAPVAAAPAAAPTLMSRLGGVARVGGAALVPLMESARVAEVAARPDSTMNDAATAIAEGASRTAGTFLGGAKGAALGSALGPLGAAVGGVIGGGLGYFAPDVLTKIGRGLLPGRSISGEFGMGSAPAAAPAVAPVDLAPRVSMAGMIPPASSAAPPAGGEQYLDPAVYGPIASAMGMGGAVARPAARPVMGQNAYGVDPTAVRTNTVQRVTAPDGTTVYTNYAPAGSPEAAAPLVEPAPVRAGGVGGTQARGVSGAVDSLIGLAAIRTARADQMKREELQNKYQTAVATQLLKNQEALAGRKPVVLTGPNFSQVAIDQAAGTVTSVDANNVATVRPIQAAPPPFSQQSVQALNRRLMEENPGSSLAQRRAAIEGIYGNGKIEDAWLR